MSDRPSPSPPTCGTCANYRDTAADGMPWCVLRKLFVKYDAVPNEPCHCRPEPVAPPGLPPYLEREPGSAFGPPLECDICNGTGSVRLYRSPSMSIPCRRCKGNGYVNAVRMEEPQ